MVSRLERYQHQYENLQAELTKIGFISSGSVMRRYTSCGKAGCKCQADPPQRHGPYWQWTRKVAGKTVTRRLTEAEADLYRQWIDNGRQLNKIVANMETISTKAGEALLRQAATTTD